MRDQDTKAIIENQPTLIIGGTRGTGLLIARLLEQRGVPLRVLARNPTRARVTLGSGVEIAAGDITEAESLPRAIEGVKHIIFTAGCRSGYPASEKRIKVTEYDGVVNTLAAATHAGFAGRFMYMTASGVGIQSWMAMCLNLYKGNTLKWRRRAEDAIRASGVNYTIIRAGMLQNSVGGQRAIKISQQALPLSIRYGVARADVAQVFVEAMEHPGASRATFEVVWAGSDPSERWPVSLNRLKQDAVISE